MKRTLFSILFAVAFSANAGNVLDSEATDFESEAEYSENEMVYQGERIEYGFEPFVVHQFDRGAVPGLWWTNQNFGLSNEAGWGIDVFRW